MSPESKSTLCRRGPLGTTKKNDTMTSENIIAEMQAVAIKRDNHNSLYNEGRPDGYNPHESRLSELSQLLHIARSKESPLATREGIEAERAWAKSQGWTATNVQAANKACIARGYSLAELQAAIKTL